MSEKQNEIAVVAWHLAAKNMIKFDGHTESYKLNEKVLAASDYTKYPLTKGTKVSYEVKDNIVVFLRREEKAKKAEEPKEEPKKEEPKAAEKQPETKSNEIGKPDAVTAQPQELTVYSVAANKNVVKFSHEGAWVNVSPKIMTQDYTVIGLLPKKRVTVTIVNNEIIAVAPSTQPEPDVKTPAPEAKKQPETSSGDPKTSTDAFYRVKELERTVRYLQNEKQASIEAQAAVNAANDLIGRIAASMPEKPTGSKLNDFIALIADANFNLIQTLKAKAVKE